MEVRNGWMDVALRVALCDLRDPLLLLFEEEVIFIRQLTWVSKQKLAE